VRESDLCQYVSQFDLLWTQALLKMPVNEIKVLVLVRSCGEVQELDPRDKNASLERDPVCLGKWNGTANVGFGTQRVALCQAPNINLIIVAVAHDNCRVRTN
jgi:hypothetical protein